MKFNFKKIAPILAGAVLLGSTIGIASVLADLGSYPAPFVKDGVADVAIVYGADGMAIDMEAAALLSADLASELAAQTAEAGGEVTTVIGENVDISLPSRRLVYNDYMNTARSELVEANLPTKLASGDVVDNDDIHYPYTQKLTLIAKQIAFSSSGEAIDPILHLNIGTTGSSGVYNYTVTFSKNIQVNDTSAVAGYASIDMQGVEYIIGPGSTNASLILYGASSILTTVYNEELTITLADVEHTVKFKGTTATNTGVLEIDGKSKTITQGASTNFAGDVVVYAKYIHQYSSTDQTLNDAELVVGTKKLTLANGKAVTYLKGGEDITMSGTLVGLTGLTGNYISGLTIGQAFDSTKTKDHIAVGESFTDRVFGGLKVDFSSATPALDSALRESIVIKSPDNVGVDVTFTPAYSGKEYTLGYVLDNDRTASDSDFTPILATAANYSIHVVENETIQQNELVVVNANDQGTIWQLLSAGSGQTGDKTTFRDVLTGDDIVFDTGTLNQSQKGLYYVYVNSPTNAQYPDVTVTWGATATYNDYGTEITMYPRIKLKNGEWLAILTSKTITNATTISLPGDELLSDYTTGTALARNFTADASNIQVGYINYTITAASDTTATLAGVDVDGDEVADCNFNTTLGPAILLVEEKQVGIGETDGRALCVPLTTWAPVSGGAGPYVNAPQFVGTSSGAQSLAKTNPVVYQYIDVYGTFVEHDKTTGTAGKVTIKYPDTQMIANVFIAEIAAEAAVTEPTAVGVVKLGDVVLSDDEAEASKPLNNLIVVGGSAVNKVSAKLLELPYPTYGGDEAWKTATGVTGEGMAIVQLFANPYSAAKKAMLVAGWEGPDTVAAAKQVIDKTSTLVGLDKKVIKKGVDYT